MPAELLHWRARQNEYIHKLLYTTFMTICDLYKAIFSFSSFFFTVFYLDKLYLISLPEKPVFYMVGWLYAPKSVLSLRNDTDFLQNNLSLVWPPEVF